MSAVFVWLLVPVCALVIFACICRVNVMRYGQNRFGWIAIYIMFAPFALGMAIDLLSKPDIVEWWSCFGLVGVALHIVLTRHHWSRGAPGYTRLESPS